MMSTTEIKERIGIVLDKLDLTYSFFVACDYKNASTPWYIEALADKLTELKEEEGARLCVSMPPRHSKSSMVTLAYPLWLIWQDPNLDILIVNSSAGLSENFGIRLRELFKTYEESSGVYLSDVKHSSTHLKFQDENGKLYNGSIRLVGATGSITGTNADYLIIDDPYKGFEDITPTLLQKKINWFQNIILQRLEPDSRLIICHTRWSENDLQGYLQTHHPQEYNFISYSAIQEDGTSLWSERYSLDFLEQRREEMGERLFEAIYQQKPLDETSDFFRLDNIDFEPEYNQKDLLHSIRAWDIASSESTKADYTAGVLMHKTRTGEYIITDLVHGHYGGNNLRVIQNTAQKDGANTKIYIETGIAAAGELLFKEWRQQLHGYNVKQARPIKSKVDRATPLQNAILDGKLKISIMDDKLRGELIHELLSFPDGVHDDIIDACSYAFNYLRTKNTKTQKVPTRLQLWR